MRLRFLLLLTGTTLAFTFLAYSLYSLQISQGEYYLGRAQAQSSAGAVLAAQRGIIYFTDKNNSQIPAAINKDYQVIFAVPTEIEDVAETSARIAQILELDVEEVQVSLSKSKDQYEELVPKANDEQLSAVREAAIKGIHVATKRARFYPFGDLAAHVLGFVSEGKNGVMAGQYGIEAQYNEILSGEPGHFDDSKQVVDAVKGQSVVLTIDLNIQSRAQEVLTKLIEDYQAVGGSVIVQDPRDGRILAMSSYPTFDPNFYSESPIENFINPAVQNFYEPGSVNKVLTMVAGIDTGAITPDSTYEDLGFITSDGKTIRNWDLKAHGVVDMREVIAKSINTGAAFAEAKTGHAKFYQYLLDFGFKDLTGLDLPGETAGRLTPLEQYPRDINFTTASYGQGITVTPIRLITIISGLANRGLMHQPYISNHAQSLKARRIMKEETANQVVEMMVYAVDQAVIPTIRHYQVAGKTGTAFVPDFEVGGYTDDVINTYLGFAPASAPHFTILFKMDKPEGAPLAGQTIVPAFRELAQFLLSYYNIAPDAD